MLIRRRLLTTVTSVAVVAVLALTSCGGDGADPVSKGKTPDEVMALAKSKIDDTAGVHITLATDDLPADVQGIKVAEGIGTHAPAFEGDITVVLSGQDFKVPVIAVDAKVYAQIPLTPGWQDIDPGDYGAPDPADLMSKDAGFSSLLPATTGLEEGDSVRGGVDNKEILTQYTGMVPGSAVKNVIPTASGEFEATYTLTDEGELREAVLTGVFYEDAEPMTYTIGFDDYGTEKDITAP